jgi:hypothetical protein
LLLLSWLFFTLIKSIDLIFSIFVNLSIITEHLEFLLQILKMDFFSFHGSWLITKMVIIIMPYYFYCSWRFLPCFLGGQVSSFFSEASL